MRTASTLQHEMLCVIAFLLHSRRNNTVRRADIDEGVLPAA